MVFHDDASSDSPPSRSRRDDSSATVAAETVRDAASVANYVSKGVFFITHKSVDFGFGSAIAVSRSVSSLVPSFSALTSTLSYAYVLTDSIVSGYEYSITSSLSVADAALDVGGVRSGRSLEKGISKARSNGWLYADGEEFVRALMRIFKMVGRFLEEEASDFSHVLAGLPLVRKFHAQLLSETEHTHYDHDVSEVSKACNVAMTGYGVKALKVLGIIPLRSTSVFSDEDAIKHMVPETMEILKVQSSSQGVYAPGHAVFLSTDRKLYVSVRGTMRISDVVADLVCHHEPYFERGESARAHGGMLVAARRLDGFLRPLLLERADDYDEIVVCGHSLGAGTATLLAGIWEKSSFNVKAFAFAPPCVVDLETSHEMSHLVTSVVMKNDFVSRFGLESTRELRDLAVGLSKNSINSFEEFVEHRHLVRESRKGKKLYPGGEIVVFRDEGIVTKENALHFDEILLTEGIFAVHMPNVYHRRACA